MKGGNISDPKDSNGSQKGENCGLIYHEGCRKSFGGHFDTKKVSLKEMKKFPS